MTEVCREAKARHANSQTKYYNPSTAYCSLRPVGAVVTELALNFTCLEVFLSPSLMVDRWSWMVDDVAKSDLSFLSRSARTEGTSQRVSLRLRLRLIFGGTTAGAATHAACCTRNLPVLPVPFGLQTRNLL